MITSEQLRVDALHNFHILDTPPDPAFERITELAAHSFGVPVSCITLVDDSRMWMKSSHGTDIRELPHEPGMCLATVRKGALHVVPDTLEDPECRENSTVKSGLRFYAAAPLITTEGHCIGTICVLDVKPRQLSPQEEVVLTSLARFAMSEIENHRNRLEAMKAREERRRIEARSQQTQRLESLGTLAGGIAHDFNNLLVGMLGNASTALSMLPPDAPVRPVVNRIEEAALRAADLVNELMAYAGRSRLEAVPMDVAELIAETTRLLEASISKKASLVSRFEGGVPAIKGDPVQIRQVVMNLITNASDALAGEAGTIRIEVFASRLASGEIVVSRDGTRLPDGDYVCLRVCDSGCGMDEATREQMFEPFFTTRQAGRGLGLAAVSGIVAAHSGAIMVDTTPGAGTRVSVLFPACEEPIRDAGSTEPERAAPVRSGEVTILVVDDEPMVQDVARMMLEAEGHKVRVVTDGRAALEVIEREGAAISAVLLDVSMPDLNGDEVCRRIHAVYPDMPVILTSGHSHDVVTRDLGGRSPVGFLQKPYRKAQLVKAIRDAIDVSR